MSSKKPPPNTTGACSSTNPQLPKPSLREYQFGPLVGKGTYGYVFRATKNASKDVVAIKCILLNTLSKNTQNNVINEISILKNLKHQFIVQMLDFHWDNNFIYLVFEFCPGGELATILHLKRCFSEEIVQHFLQQLAAALQFLRENDISHMDLKPQNILISGIAFVNLLNELNSFRVWRNVVLKIADFGFAQHLSDQEIASSFRGSPLYMAPEIFLQDLYDARVDLWSIGVILYQCLFGQTPYNCNSCDDLIHKFKAKKIKISIPSKPKISNNCRDLIKRLLELNPKERISFDAFFQHPFLDLEHMPTSDSYKKAQDILVEAVREDKNKNYLQAFYCYREAIFYLMPLYKWGDLKKPYNTTTQTSLKSRIAQYMERAEQIQIMCGIRSIEPELLEAIQQVYNLIDSAHESVENDLLEQAMEQYESAIEKSLKILKKSDKTVRTEFFGEINDWMSEAEQVKAKLSQAKAKLKEYKSSSLKHAKSEGSPIQPHTSASVKTQQIVKVSPFNSVADATATPAPPQPPQPSRLSRLRRLISLHHNSNDESTPDELSSTGANLKGNNTEPSCNIQ